MATTFHFTTYVYRGRNEREFPVEVSYTVTPRVAATYWQPAEGGEVEVLDAKLIGDSYPITSEEWDRIQDVCEGRADEDLADAEADRADYLYDQHRDRQMMARWEGEAA